MSSPRGHRLRIGINAQKLSLSLTYHAAGSSRYVFNLLRELRGIGAAEEVIAYANDANVPAELAPTGGFEVRAVRWPTTRPALRVLWEQLVFPRVLRNDCITVLHGAVNALPVAWRGKSIVTILDLSFLLMPTAFNRPNRMYLRWMAWYSARRANQVVAISEATRRDVIKLLGVSPERVIRVYCGVDARFHPIDDHEELHRFRQAHSLPERFILYLGTIEPRKNLVRLMDAYAELRRRGATAWPLVLAGGRGWRDEAIVHYAARLGLEDAVRFAGFVPEEEIPLWYNAAAFFVYPSAYEGFGLPPLEALACGTPVVASNRASLPEVLGDAAVLVDPSDTGAIVDGMQRMLEDDPLRSRLSSLGPQRASAFSWRRMAEETLAVYRSVASST